MIQTLDEIDRTLENILDLLDSEEPEDKAFAEELYSQLEP